MRHFSSILIWKIVYSPLLWREVRRILRSKKSFLAFFALLALLLVIFQRNWDFILQSWKLARDISQSNRWLFYGIAQAHLYFLAIFAPFLFAPLIAEERERGTFELLAASPLPIFHILAAKQLAGSFYFLLLLAGTLPVLSLALFGGGVSPPEIARIYLLIAAAFFFFGGLGAFCSTLSDRISRVYIYTGLAVFFFIVVLPHLLTIIVFLYNGFYFGVDSQFRDDPFFQFLHRCLENVNPFAAMRMEFFPERTMLSIGIPGTPVSTHAAFYFYIVWSVSMAIAFYALALARMNRLARLDPRSRKKKNPNAAKKGKLWDYLSRDVANDLSQAIERRRDLLGKAAQRFQWFFHYGTLIRISYIGIIFSLLTIPICTTTFLFLMPLLLPIPFALPMAASGVSSEKERGTWELLRTTLLPARHIVESKIRIYHQYGLALALSFYAPGMVFRLFHPFNAQDIARGGSSRAEILLLLAIYPVVIFLALKAITAFSFFCSARMRRSHWALTASLACYLFILFASPGMEIVPHRLPISYFLGIRMLPGWSLIEENRFFSCAWAIESVLGLLAYGAGFLSPLYAVKKILPSANSGFAAPISAIPFAQNPFLILLIQLAIYGVVTEWLLRRTSSSLEKPE
ncbi:MAG: ABC transporter permease subunit [Candidatus Omnitrophota bacterium]